MTDEAKTTGLDLLREPFPAHQISKLPKPFKKDAQKGNCKECGGYHGLPAAHLDYVGHAALTDRLLDADINWTWEPLAFGSDGLPQFDRSGGLWIRLTVCGVSRLGYGNAAEKGYMDVGAREKEVIGDALRNAAMRFGAALDLWHKGQLHVDSENATSSTSAAPESDAQTLAPTQEEPQSVLDESTGELVPFAPKGFDSWWTDMIACADNGKAALDAAWAKSDRTFKEYTMNQKRQPWANLKKHAAAAVAQ